MENNITQNKNIFVYGTLALKDKQRELGLTYKDVIEYDYIKGYKLWEITDNGDVYLQARKEEGIISGSILIDCNIDECLDALDKWEGEQYTREIITTEINKTECIMYIFNSNKHKKKSLNLMVIWLMNLMSLHYLISRMLQYIRKD